VIAELKRILLAEDNANDVELTVTALRENHVVNEVIVVRDGAQALDYLYKRNEFADRAGQNPALVLLDLKMPKVDGIEVLKQVKSDPGMRSVPIVVLTSSREEQDLVSSYKLGVNAYVVKPVDFRAFIAAVRQLGAFWAVVNEPPPGGAVQHS
jgi:CheY-like chemotaxis protein